MVRGGCNPGKGSESVLDTKEACISEKSKSDTHYENPAEYPPLCGGDECGAGVRGDAIPLIALHNAPLLKAGFFTLSGL